MRERTYPRGPAGNRRSSLGGRDLRGGRARGQTHCSERLDGGMHLFRVWSPTASEVSVVVGRADAADLGLIHGRQLLLERVEEPGRPGWWEVAVDEAGEGTDYLFRLDGGPGRPDPRSCWQPFGVIGPSRLVDHSGFPWSDGSWRGIHLPSAVLYEIHVGTFSEEGTFDGARAHLDHLVDLGVDAVELMPVAEASGERGWGYDGVDLFAPHHAYGGPAGMKRFVDAAHARGLGVVLDVVYNHLGPVGNFLSEFGPYFSERHRTNWGAAVNFDGPFSDEVRHFVIDNARMWLSDYHLDGLRLDAVHAISDSSAVHVLERLAGEVRQLGADLGRQVVLIAESDLNDPRFVRSPDAGGYGIDAAWADEFHHALHAALTGERSGYYEDFGSLAALATALRRGWVYAGEWSPHRKRTHGRPPTGLSADRFVVSLQNHDQVGNRARGERLGALCGKRRARIGAALLLTAPFVPMLFQGEEWDAASPFQYFTDHRDGELGRAVSEGRRAEFSAFGWGPEEVPDPQDPETFARSKLCWAELERQAHDDMLAWYRELLALRRRTPGLAGARLPTAETVFDEAAGWLLVERPGLAVALNLGAAAAHVPLGGRVGSWRPALVSDPGIELRDATIVLPPDSLAVLAPREEEPAS